MEAHPVIKLIRGTHRAITVVFVANVYDKKLFKQIKIFIILKNLLMICCKNLDVVSG